MSRDLKSYVAMAKKDFQQKELERLGITPEHEQYEQIIHYFCLLYSETDARGILPVEEKGKFFIKHFCDSIQPLLLFGFKTGASLLTINSGAGFPAFPLAFFRQGLSVTMQEDNAENRQFLQECIEVTGLQNICVVDSAEGEFDYVVERGADTLQSFTRKARGFVKKDGRMYTFRTENFERELSDITMNKESEGVRVHEIAEYDLANQIYGLNLVSFDLYS